MKRLLYLPGILLLSTSCIAQHHADDYGPNAIMASVVANNTGPGFGLQYERFLGGRMRTSLVMPVFACLGYAPARPSFAYQTEGEDRRPLMILVEPGFRFYPTSGKGVVRYSIGAHLMIGAGQGASEHITNGTDHLTARSITGLLINHNIHVQMGRHVRMDLEFGFGVGTDDGYNNAGAPVVGQASASLGYRW